MRKSRDEILQDVAGLTLPTTSFEEYERRAREAKKSGRRAPLMPSRAKVKNLSVADDGTVELRALVDLDDDGPAPYATPRPIGEIIINNVKLKNATIAPARPPESGFPRMEVLLSGKADPAKLRALRSYPLSLRVRSEDDSIQIDGFELDAPG